MHRSAENWCPDLREVRPCGRDLSGGDRAGLGGGGMAEAGRSESQTIALCRGQRDVHAYSF